MPDGFHRLPAITLAYNLVKAGYGTQSKRDVAKLFINAALELKNGNRSEMRRLLLTNMSSKDEPKSPTMLRVLVLSPEIAGYILNRWQVIIQQGYNLL